MPTPPALTEGLLEWRQRHEARHGRLASGFAQGTALFWGHNSAHGMTEIRDESMLKEKKRGRGRKRGANVGLGSRMDGYSNWPFVLV